jgi:hypothetical protein
VHKHPVSMPRPYAEDKYGRDAPLAGML